MNHGLHLVIGMTFAYVASLVGLVLAWIYYKKNYKGRKR